MILKLCLFATLALAGKPKLHLPPPPERVFASTYKCEVPCSDYYFDYTDGAGDARRKNPTFEIDCRGLKRSEKPEYDECITKCVTLKEQKALDLCRSEIVKCGSCSA